VLIAILVVGMAAAGIAVAIVTAARIHLSFMNAVNDKKRAQVRLQGILDWACVLVATSPYNGATNLRLAEADPTADGVPGTKPLCQFGECRVTVNRLSENLYELCASCSGADPLILRVSPTSFPARFCLVTPDSLNISNSSYLGAVLCGSARFILSKPRLFTSPILSLSRPLFSSRQAAFSPFTSGIFDETPLPLRILDPLTPLVRKHRRGKPLETLDGMVVARTNCTVIFERDIVRIETDAGDKVHIRLDAPLTILVLGDCRVQGELSGRVSIVASGRVRIVGDILYLANGAPLSITKRGVDTRGNASLAIVARGDILYDQKNENLTVCGALVSVCGSIHPAFSRRAGKLTIFGTRICAERPWRRRKGLGFAKAVYIADPAILNFPPPILPKVTLPRFFAYQVVLPERGR